MDILNELKFFDENNSVLDIVKSIRKEQEYLDKKIHLFKVLSLINDLNNLVDSPEVELFSLKNINLEYINDTLEGTSLYSIIYDKNGVEFRAHKVNSPEAKVKYKNIKTVSDSIDNLRHFKFEDTNLEPFKKLEIKLEKNELSKAFDLLLSQELKTIYHYNRMALKIENKDKEQNKLKI